MAKARGRLADWLSWMGNRIFGFLSGCEEKGVMPRVSRGLKLSLLGGILSLIACVSPQFNRGNSDFPTTCYIADVRPKASIRDFSLHPDPTGGSDTITVSVTAHSQTYAPIAIAFCSVGDSVKIMRALDGQVDERIEELEASFYVGDLAPCTAQASVIVITDDGAGTGKTVDFVVSEPDSAKTEE